MGEWAGKEEEKEEEGEEEGEGVGRVAEVARAVAVHRSSLLGREKFRNYHYWETRLNYQDWKT